MHRKIIILAALFIASAHAEELKIKQAQYRSSLYFETSKVSFKGEGIELSLVRNECSEKIASQFEKEVSFIIKKMPVEKTKDPQYVEVEFKGKKSYASRFSKAGTYFLQMAERFKRLKIQSLMKCKV